MRIPTKVAERRSNEGPNGMIRWFILIPNVNASVHRFFCLSAVSLLSQRSSATLPFVCYPVSISK